MDLQDFKNELKNWRSWIVVFAFGITSYFAYDANMEAENANQIAEKANKIANQATDISKNSYQLQQAEYQSKTEFVLGGKYDEGQGVSSNFVPPMFERV